RVALLKGVKLDWAGRKRTEVGVAGICFVEPGRQVRTARGERWDNRLARLSAIAREAVEQCGRVRFPSLSGPIAMDDYLRSRNPTTLIADPVSAVPLEVPLKGTRISVRMLFSTEVS